MDQQIDVNPAELEQFARNLKAFANQLRDSTSQLQGQFGRLGDTWRDQQHAKFAQEFEQTMRLLHHFIRSADDQAPRLERRAQGLRDGYLNQP